jgi:hypothetical protein
MSPACGTHGEEKTCFYTGFDAEIDRLEELGVDGLGPFLLDFFSLECIP